MKLRSVFAAGALVLAALSTAGCSKVEGTYKIDKTEMKKVAEAEIAKMPAEQQGMAKMGLALIDSMEVTIDLKSGGAAEFKMSVMGQDKTETGEWKADGKKVTIKSKDKEGKESEINCEADGGKLTCENPKEKGPMNKMVFNKA
jgi:hypothetical protein